jgi:phosphatidate cytidylyltransferase
MLLQRVLTSIVLLLIILGSVFGLSENFFSLFIGLVISIAIWEWSALAGLSSLYGRAAYLLTMIAVMFISLHIPLPVFVSFSAGLVFWVIAFLLVCIFPAGGKAWGKMPILLFAGLPLFIPGWLAFTWLRSQDHFAFHVLLLLGLVASADIGAFFAGKKFGRLPLSPSVSPNKTWEGFAGGLFASGLLISLVTIFLVSRTAEVNILLWVKYLLSALLIASFSVVGDLFESMIKRFRDVKDSGTILPGHGGMLDRIDGLNAGAPIYALLVLLMTIGKL